MFGFNIWQIVFAVIAFPILTTIGVIQFRQFEQRDFQPRNVEQREIEQKQLSAARDLKSTWSGVAHFDSTKSADGGYCAYTRNVILNITSQTDNQISGVINFTEQSTENRDGANCIDGTGQMHGYEFSGNVSSSSITIQLNGDATYSGSFTSDIITLNEAHGLTDYTTLAGPINLLRQK